MEEIDGSVRQYCVDHNFPDTAESIPEGKSDTSLDEVFDPGKGIWKRNISENSGIDYGIFPLS